MENNDVYQRPVASSFQAVFENDELFERIVELFPFPVQVFSPDGTVIMINKAALELLSIRKESHVGKYNVLRNPNLFAPEILDQVMQVLSGKTVYLHDFQAPFHELIKEDVDIEDRNNKTMLVDITYFPIMKQDNTVGCFISVFFIKSINRGRDDIQLGREYIETHWREKYNAAEVANAANLSGNQFSKLFKTYIGKTPHDYYINIKIRKLQEQLLDTNLTVSEAFAACGLDYHGNFARVFKQVVGLTPSQYRGAAKHRKKI